MIRRPNPKTDNTNRPLEFWSETKIWEVPIRSLWALLLLGLFLGILAPKAGAKGYDHAPLDALLAAHVRGDGVDYDGLAAHTATLNAYLAPARHFDPETLSRDEAMAFWINMYNAWTLKFILTKYPKIDSIKDLGSLFSSPWKKRFVKIGGKILTLGEIEHEILRVRFKDPRIHFAINCASRSCPPLLSEAYRAEILDAQLDGVTRAFINRASNTQFRGNRLLVSRIFKWYAGDFDPGIASYIKRYAQGSLKEKFEIVGNSPQISFMPYDWSLNTP